MAVLALVSAACATSPGSVSGPALDLTEPVWRTVVSSRGVAPDDVPSPFEATPEMVDAALLAAGSGTAVERLDRIQRSLFDPAAYTFEYEGNTTLTAREAFAARRGNCVSFTNLFIALARAAKVPVQAAVLGTRGESRKQGDLVVVYAHLVAVHRGPQGLMAYDFSHTRMGLVTSVKLLDDPGVAAILENNRGTADLRKGRLASAREHLERAVALLPDYAPVQGNLGIALLRAGDAAAASTRFEKALRLAPDDPSTLFNIASLYRQAGRVGDALALLRKADLGSASPWLLLARGDLEMSQGDIAAALRSYRKAASRGPELVEPLLAIARAEKARGNDAAARRALDKALELSPESEEARNLVSAM
ncbi:MAG: tetratricopeptide repeat protein [Acidobacteria bacterium]|nr:tetratricopeptide repeat protein [Acidobacteriota bacterium]